MTLDQAFGTGNVTVSTVSGKTRVTFKRTMFPRISSAEANASTGDIRKVVYGVISKFVSSVAFIRSQDSGANTISNRDLYENIYPTDDMKYSSIMSFDLVPLLDDVKNEP